MKIYSRVLFLDRLGSFSSPRRWHGVHLTLGLALIGAIVCLPPAFAQEQFGQISGLVMDGAGAAVPGASVKAVNDSTGVVRSTTTNAEGNYFLASLTPGVYKVTASHTGFKSITQPGIVLNVSQRARVDVMLEVGDLSQSVTVSGAGSALQTESASVGTVIAESGVANLPLNGRNYLQLAALTPGVIVSGTLGAATNGNLFNTIQAGGLRNSTTSYAIDGADVTNQKAIGTSFTPSPDAIAEFKIDTNNMSVRNGAGGAAVNVALKSGTNAFHGGIYEFFRNDVMNARNFFALTNPEHRQNQFGGSLGGPLRKNRIFFFADYQGLRLRDGSTKNSVVPTAAQRTGNFAGGPQIKDPFTGQPIANNQIPASAIAPQTAFFLPFIPLPNSGGGTYVSSAPSSTNSEQFDIRVDLQLCAADALTFTYSFQDRSDFAPGAYPGIGALTSPARPQFAVATWTHTFSPGMVNQARLSYTHFGGSQNQQGLGTNYTLQAGIGGFSQTSTFAPAFPDLAISGFAGVAGNALVPYRHRSHNWNFGDALTLVRGHHTVEFGVDMRWWEDTHTNAQNSRGTFSFTGVYSGNGFADYLYGVPFSGTRGFPLSLFGVFQQNQDAFAQDTWKVSRKLTLIAGIRYDLIHPFVPLNNGFAAVDIGNDKLVVASDSQGAITTNAQLVTPYVLPIYQSRIVPASQLGLPSSLAYTNTHDFAPRSGVAYDAGHGIAVRAGFGLFRMLNSSNVAPATTQVTTPPFAANETPTNTTPVPSRTIATFFPTLSPGSVNLLPAAFASLNPNLPTPYSEQWNLSVQKVVHRVISLQAAYVGNKGTHLSLGLPTNVPKPGPGALQMNRSNPFWSAGTLASQSGNSSYNALQLTSEVRSWHGLYLLASYVWGKSLDTESTDGSSNTVQDPYNLRAERAISAFNRASRFTFASTYVIPFLRGRHDLLGNLMGGWSLSNIVIVQSGQPFTPAISANPSNTGTTNRPNRIADGSLPDPTINRWFDAAAFTVPAAYTYGNSARDVLTGPGLKNWDISLFKDFKLPWREAAKLQFRGEMYNFTNTPPFGLPVANIQTTATVGRVLSAGPARSAQLVLKAIF